MIWFWIGEGETEAGLIAELGVLNDIVLIAPVLEGLMFEGNVIGVKGLGLTG